MKQSHREYLALQSWLHLSHDRIRDAITLLEAMAVLVPADAWVHRSLSYAYMRDGQFERCLEYMDRHLGSQSTRSGQLVRLRALWGAGRLTEARELLGRLDGRLGAGS